MTPIALNQVSLQPPRFGMASFWVARDANGNFPKNLPREMSWFYHKLNPEEGLRLYLVNNVGKQKKKLGDQDALNQALTAWNTARKNPETWPVDFMKATRGLEKVRQSLAKKATPWPVSA